MFFLYAMNSSATRAMRRACSLGGPWLLIVIDHVCMPSHMCASVALPMALYRYVYDMCVLVGMDVSGMT